MSDRTTAGVFCKVFCALAREPITEETKTIARGLYQDTGEYDFNKYQMECDDALIALGLARRGKDEDGNDTVLYE